MEPLQVMTLKKMREIQRVRQDKHDLIYGLIVLCGFIGLTIFAILSTMSLYFMIGTTICLIIVILSVKSALTFKNKIPMPNNAVAALKENMPRLFKSSAGGVKYVADIAYNLLSKWIKENHCPLDRPNYLQSAIIDLRINLSLLILHLPEVIPLNNENLPAGEFKFNDVRKQGPASLEWKLLPDGELSFKLIHDNKDLDI